MLSDDARIAVESEVSAILVHPIRLRLEKNTTTKADVGRRRGWGQRRVVPGVATPRVWHAAAGAKPNALHSH